MHFLPPDDAVIDAINASADAVLDLQGALAAAGLTLPSLGIDLVACTRALDPRPLVELGRCNPDTTRALAAALRKAAAQ